MATLPINNVESLSYQREYNFLGEIFCYSSTDSYTIKSRVRGTGSNPEASIDPVWSGLDNITKNSLNYYDFVIDNLSLGSGKITSFQWDPGSDVGSKPYTMSFEIGSSGNLYNLTGDAYSDINKQSFFSELRYVTDLQENISISLSQTNVQELQQSLSFGIKEPLNFNEKLSLRNSIFSGFFINRMPSGLGMNTYSMNILTGQTSGHISYYNETIDAINNEYSFRRISSFDNTNQKASWRYNHSVQLNGNNTSVIERGTIQSNYFAGTGNFRNLSGARDRWADISTGIFRRISGTFMALSGFSGVYPTGYKHELSINPLQKSFTENPLEGTIFYSYGYTDALSYSKYGYIYGNERSSSIDEDGYYNITERGDYRGIANSQSKRFENASGAYYTDNVPIRISGAFDLASGLNPLLCAPTINFRIVNESTTFQEFEGVISYNKSYSNNPSYYPESSKFIKYKNRIQDIPPVHLFKKILIPRHEEEIQSLVQSTEGSWTNSINILGKTGVSIQEYLNEAFSKVVQPQDVDNYFLRDMKYSFDPFNNSFNASFQYYYSKYREENNFLI